MRQWRLLCGLVMIISVMFTACGRKADYDVRGAWDYTMVAEDGNIYDTGTITFSGEPGSGMFVQENIYSVLYEGEYTVKGVDIRLSGDESWEGILASATAMSGVWSHVGESKGTWTAIKQAP